MANKLFNRQLFKKWWFWAILAVVIIVGATSDDDGDTITNPPQNNSSDSSATQEVGKLPVLNKAEYMDNEGLVVFKDLSTKGYTVTAKYVNENVPAVNQDFTEQFTSAEVNSCQDRLGFDAYLVSGLTQEGDTVSLALTNKPTNNQTCPAGTVNDL